ncbi:PIN domain-containing protein [Aggregatilineales bacterium SYSU G02658]
MIALVDSNVIIDLIRGYAPAQEWLADIADELHITSITQLEVIHGARDKRAVRITLELLRQFDVVYLTPIDQQQAYHYLLSYGLSHNVELTDCLIAAACARTRAPLYTRNLKHMRPLLGDLAVSPYL